ncbi:CDP-glycerol glycerophosphotransferase family protein [Shewanella sp. 10N.286.45.A1]|uniref:CDP-glycerol glycerophosphotransferase family protein n=1 Tax=Shewanella sp. 10N.286.45.A1 TaxID=3229694 RepID=UPI003553E30C
MIRKILAKSKLALFIYSEFNKIKMQTVLFIARYTHHNEVLRIKKKVKNGEKIKVTFLVMDKSVWKTDLVYQAMVKDKFYDPSIVVIPRVTSSDVMKTAEQTYEFFRKKMYKTTLAYQDCSWKPLNEIVDSDIIFISNPHKITAEDYYISSLKYKLTCYVPYFEQIDNNYKLHFDGETENLVWKIFQINNIHKKIALKHATNRGSNVVVVGYPATEAIYTNTINESSPWLNDGRKNIIIAPHHNINGIDLSNSTFLDNAELLQSLASKYKAQVKFAFKPHPLLKDNLYKHPDWGVVRTNKYWDFWNKTENCQLETGDYVQLFKKSDGMIHDCSSFLIEYLYTRNPCLYLNSRIRTKLNDYGRIGFDAVKKSENDSDIFEFIENVISGAEPKIDENIVMGIKPEKSPTESILAELTNSFIRVDNERVNQ